MPRASGPGPVVNVGGEEGEERRVKGMKQKDPARSAGKPGLRDGGLEAVRDRGTPVRQQSLA